MFVVDICSDANDPLRLSFETWNKLQDRVGPKDMPIDRVLIWKHAFRQRLAHDSHRLFALGVKIVEIAACNNGNA